METYLGSWCPSFQRENVTSVAKKPQAGRDEAVGWFDWRTSRVASLGGTAEGLSPHEHIRASCYSFLAGNRVCPNHGIAADLDQFTREAGRGRGRVQQSGAVGGVQVSSVPRRTHAAPEDLSGSVVWLADYDRRVDPVLGQEFCRGSFKLRKR